MKWACLQPLSGGFYFGAELAFGKPAEWIISFPGLDLDDSKKCPNEFPVLSYLTKKQNENSYSLTKYIGQHSIITIPKEYNNIPITIMEKNSIPNFVKKLSSILAI